MSRLFNLAGLALVTVCGISIATTALQPELIRSRAEREEQNFTTEHVTPEQHAQHVKEAESVEVGKREERDTVISRAMASDFREAGAELRKEGGFAWGIRKQLFGTGKVEEVKSSAEARAEEVAKK